MFETTTSLLFTYHFWGWSTIGVQLGSSPPPWKLWPWKLMHFHGDFEWQRFNWMNHKSLLVGGLNPIQKYQSKWESSPNRGEHKKYLKPPAIKLFKNQAVILTTLRRKDMYQHKSSNMSPKHTKKSTKSGQPNQAERHLKTHVNKKSQTKIEQTI